VQRQLGEVVRQLDTRRPQVLVEAIIVEISDNAAKQLGVQLLLAGTGGSAIPFALTNYSNASPNIATVAGAIAAEELRTSTTTVNGQVVTTTNSSGIADTLQEAAAQELLGARTGLLGLGFRAGNAIFGAIVNAVQSDNKSNLLATPSVTVIDNQPARFLAGQEVPVTSGEALGDNFENTFRTVQRQNVGISLEVTPQINAGDTVKLDIRQEVSSVAGTVGRAQFGRSHSQQARDRDVDRRRQRRHHRHWRASERQRATDDREDPVPRRPAGVGNLLSRAAVRARRPPHGLISATILVRRRCAGDEQPSLRLYRDRQYLQNPNRGAEPRRAGARIYGTAPPVPSPPPRRHCRPGPATRSWRRCPPPSAG
jgi:general secretion pathway protein D